MHERRMSKYRVSDDDLMKYVPLQHGSYHLSQASQLCTPRIVSPAAFRRITHFSKLVPGF